MMRTTINRIPVIVASVLMTLLLTACNNDMTDLHNYIDDVKARQAEPIAPIPAVKTYTPYVYEGQTGRDPFRPSTSEGSDAEQGVSNRSGPQPDRSRPKEYLEQYELDTLAMVGTFSTDGMDWGLIRDPDGVVHRVAVNDYIGRNHGRVTYVQPNEMGLSELISDGNGGWLVRQASMAIEQP